MTSDRPYRAARTQEDACDELERCAGNQFDAGVVRAFLSVTARREQRQAALFAAAGASP
jgi:HD-GYP domain-containing protein (c-di-GMP phosphodiesterase class II)